MSVIRTVSYVPLAIFAIGWLIAEIFFLTRRNKGGEELKKGILLSNLDILLAGLGAALILLIGVYLGAAARFFMIGIGIAAVLIQVALLGAAIEFSMNKLPEESGDLVRNVLVPYAIRLACSILSLFWMFIVFWAVGL